LEGTTGDVVVVDSGEMLDPLPAVAARAVPVPGADAATATEERLMAMIATATAIAKYLARDMSDTLTLLI
jgi:hypothetical protein